MNSTNYKQYDTRWASLGYPKKPYYIKGCGCGEVAICNTIIEMEQYKNETPKTIQPYAKQYAAPNGNGTYFSGIPAMMKHYGMTEVKEHDTMPQLFKELAKGNRVAILLMGSRLGGSKKVRWTSSAHFVACVGYKKSGSKDMLYIKDSNSTSSLRNGWLSYSENIKGDCLRVWSGKLNSKASSTPTPTTSVDDGKLAVDGVGGLKTVNRLQEFLGIAKTDGITIKKDLQKYVPALKAYDYGNGSPTVKAMQKWLGITQDGLWGEGTSKALQKKLGVAQDGIAGANTFKALQKYLNENEKAVYPIEPQKTAQQKAVEWARKIANDNTWHYVKWEQKVQATHECPICYKHAVGKYHGWNCIGFAYSSYYHGAGVKVKHGNGVINNAKAESILKAKTDKDATKIVQSALGSTDFVCIKRSAGMPQSLLKAGDICLYFKGSTYQHTFLYTGGGMMIDATSVSNVANQIREHKALTPKVVIRYVGK